MMWVVCAAVMTGQFYELVMVVTPGGCVDIRLILEMVVYVLCLCFTMYFL